MRIHGGRSVTIGRNTILLRGATIIANGGHVEIGEGCLVARWSVVQSVGGWIKMGDGSRVGDFCNLYGSGGLELEENVLIAAGVRIVSADHTFDRRDVPIQDQPNRNRRTTIKAGAWIASNAVILPGVTIGEGAVIGAGAVVTKDVPPYAVAVGVPAKAVRSRP